jgi:UPF0176 protein
MKDQFKIILFYKFVNLKNPEKVMREQQKLCSTLHLKGRMLLAREGINATFEGKVRDINKYKKELVKNRLFKGIVFKESFSDGRAFTKLKIKVRSEVVTLGNFDFNVKKETAKELTATELHRLYKDKQEDFVVLDLRNDYEINVGHFEKTVNDQIGFALQNFRELPEKMASLSSLKNKKVVAVCTGGIRCEKATCLLRREGFKNLYQLKDGIHTYMQKYPSKHFKGSLFVFDNRMTTPVVDTKDREIVGRCVYCLKKCEDFYSNDTVRPSRKVISCRACAKKHADELRPCLPT